MRSRFLSGPRAGPAQYVGAQIDLVDTHDLLAKLERLAPLFPVIAAHDRQLVARGLHEVELVGAAAALLVDELLLFHRIDAVGERRSRRQQKQQQRQRAIHERGPGMKSDSPSRPTRLLVTRSTATASSIMR